MGHINLINMIESYIIAWGRYGALPYYSPMGYKTLWLTKGVRICTCVCVPSDKFTYALCPEASPRGWCDDNHVKVRMGGKIETGNHPDPSESGLFPGRRSLQMMVVLFHTYQPLPGILPPELASPGRLYTPCWSSANGKPLVFGATNEPWRWLWRFQLYILDASCHQWGHQSGFAAMQREGHLGKCSCLLAVLGSYLLCLYPEPALMELL